MHHLSTAVGFGREIIGITKIADGLAPFKRHLIGFVEVATQSGIMVYSSVLRPVGSLESSECEDLSVSGFISSHIESSAGSLHPGSLTIKWQIEDSQ